MACVCPRSNPQNCSIFCKHTLFLYVAPGVTTCGILYRYDEVQPGFWAPFKASQSGWPAGGRPS
eukprot:scaffold102257_cov39-Phaeocystis_antarctica.AAC.1